MLPETPLSIGFAYEDRALDGATVYGDARPIGDFFVTTIPALRLEVTSVYVGSGEFATVPALHKISDGEGDNGSFSAENVSAPDVSDPTRPIGALPNLLYDHLGQLQAIVDDRRGEVLLVDVGDQVDGELAAAAAAHLAS